MTKSSEQKYFENVLSAERPAFLGQHRLFNKPVLPIAAIVDMVTMAASYVHATHAPAWSVHDLTLKEAISLGDKPVRLQTTVRSSDGGYSVRCLTDQGEQSSPRWKEHVSTMLTPSEQAESKELPSWPAERERWKQMPLDDYYAQLAHGGLEYGPLFRGLKGLWRENHEALAWIESPEFPGDEAYLLNPIVLDACFHALGAFSSELEEKHISLPVFIRRLTSQGPLPRKLWCHVRWHGSVRPGCYEAELTVCDEKWKEVMHIEGLQIADVLQDKAYASLATAFLAGEEAAPEQACALKSRIGIMPTEEAKGQILEYLFQSISKILKLDDAKQAELWPVFSHTKINELGLDSLMGVQLRQRILLDLGVDIPVQMFIGGSKPVDIVDLAYRQNVLNQLTRGADPGDSDGDSHTEEFVL